jgi:hypothetical protein
LLGAAVPVDGSVGNLHFPVSARDHSGLLTTQLIVSHYGVGLVPRVYLRVGAGMYTSKERYYGRRLYEFPGELHVTIPVLRALQLGAGSEGRFVVGAPENRVFTQTLSSHDAFAFGPDAIVRLTPSASLHASYRHEAIGFYATAGSYWNLAMVLGSQNSPSR